MSNCKYYPTHTKGFVKSPRCPSGPNLPQMSHVSHSAALTKTHNKIMIYLKYPEHNGFFIFKSQQIFPKAKKSMTVRRRSAKEAHRKAAVKTDEWKKTSWMKMKR